jgi:hypothetical protein
MNEFEILIRHFHGIATRPFHSAPGYHEVGRWPVFIVHDQISRSDRHANVSGRAGANVAAKLQLCTGPEAVTVCNSAEKTYESDQ